MMFSMSSPTQSCSTPGIPSLGVQSSHTPARRPLCRGNRSARPDVLVPAGLGDDGQDVPRIGRRGVPSSVTLTPCGLSGVVDRVDPQAPAKSVVSGSADEHIRVAGTDDTVVEVRAYDHLCVLPMAIEAARGAWTSRRVGVLREICDRRNWPVGPVGIADGVESVPTVDHLVSDSSLSGSTWSAPRARRRSCRFPRRRG